MANEQNLEEIHAALTQAIDVAEAKANNALKFGKISESEWLEAKDKWGRLETVKSQINGLITDKKIQMTLLNNNPDSSISKIEQATNSLNKSAGKLDDFNNFLSQINNALTIAGITIKAISSLI
ncbi:hypothetical protein [Nostoc sp. ChiQUE01b]|uniref:hypothetical protein n=1 Tax=Nostoc sp. ChiQUE01b TaxID=3075376 RepID=UPI002AD4FE4E|nr:hypothetical protein [Nostoc sp. ChiQUE01b]MDZ8260744.1 hypothetical protein [Nostoc sp. ChiQUE01b]